jgi:hypothetical protein
MLRVPGFQALRAVDPSTSFPVSVRCFSGSSITISRHGSFTARSLPKHHETVFAANASGRIPVPVSRSPAQSATPGDFFTALAFLAALRVRLGAASGADAGRAIGRVGLFIDPTKWARAPETRVQLSIA